MQYLAIIFALILPGIALAGDETGVSRSVGKYAIDNTTVLKEVIKQVNPVSALPKNSLISAAQRTARHDSDAEIDIFDAWVELSGDQDHDGFYHHLQVTFDADTTTDYETVYVKLFLSHEGGPWYQFAESDLFEIHADSADDTYEVLSELIEGYRPGYYEIMIELHSLSQHGIMDSLIIDSDLSDHVIALEDRQHDDPYSEDDYYYESGDYDVNYGVGVSGSFSMAGMIMLGLLLLIKFRYFRSRK